MFGQFQIRVAFAATLVVGVGTWCFADPAEDQYGVAAGHYSRGRWQLAAEEMKRFLSSYPNHAQAKEANFFLGEALMQLGQVKQAREYFDAFALAAPEHRYASQAKFRRGECAYLTGDYATARQLLGEFHTQDADNPLNAYALPYLGDLALMENDGALAQAHYAKALREHGETALADQCRFGLARALQLQRKFDDAKRFYDYLIERRGPFADDSLLQLGRLQYEQEAFDEAINTLGMVVKDYPQTESVPFAQYWLGVAQLEKEDYAAAISSLESVASSIDKSHTLTPAIRFQLGEAFRRGKRLEEAAAHFQLVVDESPDSSWADDAQHGLLRLASDTEQYVAVEKLAAPFLSKHAQSALAFDVRRLLGRSQVMQGKYDDAIQTLSPLVSELDQMASAESGTGSDAFSRRDARALAGSSRYTLGLAYVGAKRFAEADAAIASLTPDEQTEPELAAGVDAVRAAAWMGQQKYTQAIAPLRNYLRLAPDGPDANHSRAQLAVALAHTNQLPDAQRVYDDLAKRFTDRNEFLTTTHFLADAAFQAGEKTWARELFTVLADENNPPEFREKGLSGKAWCELDLQSPVRSAQTFDQLLKEFPDSPLVTQAALARAAALEKVDEPDSAMAMYTFIMNKYPQSKEMPAALYQAGKLADKLKQSEQAETLLRRYISEYPQQPNIDNAIYRLAWVLLDAKRETEARELFGTLHRDYPKSRFWADATFRVAQGAALAGDYAGVSKLVDEMVASGTTEDVLSHALYLKGQAAAKLGHWNEVTPALEQLLATFPKSPLKNSAEYWIAESLYRQDKFAESAERFAALAQRTQGQTDTWLAAIPMRRGQVLAHERKWAAAYAMAEHIAEQYPGFSQQYEVDYLLGRCLANQARFQDARDAFERVTNSVHGRRTEMAAKAQWNIGESYFHQKDYDNAIRAYSRVELLYDFPRWQALSLLQMGKCFENLNQWSEAVSRYEQILSEFANTESTTEAKQRLATAREKAKVAGGSAAPGETAPASGTTPLDARSPIQGDSR